MRHSPGSAALAALEETEEEVDAQAALIARLQAGVVEAAERLASVQRCARCSPRGPGRGVAGWWMWLPMYERGREVEEGEERGYRWCQRSITWGLKHRPPRPTVFAHETGVFAVTSGPST